MFTAETPKSRAMVGSAVASTVTSICSINSAAATISEVTRKSRAGAVVSAGAARCSLRSAGT